MTERHLVVQDLVWEHDAGKGALMEKLGCHNGKAWLYDYQKNTYHRIQTAFHLFFSVDIYEPQSTDSDSGSQSHDRSDGCWRSKLWRNNSSQTVEMRWISRHLPLSHQIPTWRKSRFQIFPRPFETYWTCYGLLSLCAAFISRRAVAGRADERLYLKNVVWDSPLDNW